MINCSNFNDYVCAYIDNELDIKERLSFDEHIRSCTKCKRELDEMAQVIGLCKSLPQHELPEAFKDELHEKLVAVAERQGSEIISPVKSRKFRYFRTFGAIAAGFLLVIAAGIYLRAGLFPMKTENMTNDMASAIEAPAAADNESRAGSYKLDSSVGAAEDAGAMSKSMAAPEAALAGSAEIDRSAAEKNRDTASAQLYLAAEETASGNFSTITISTDDMDVQLQKIKQLALENNSEITDNILYITFANSIQSGSGQSGYSGTGGQPADYQDNAGKPAGDAAAKSTEASAPADQTAGNQAISAVSSKAVPSSNQLIFSIPRTQYEQFVSSLNGEYGTANVQVGAIVTNDVSSELNGAVAQSIALDNKIQELQTADSKKNASEIENLKRQKESVDKLIDDLRLGNDFVNVTVLLKGK